MTDRELLELAAKAAGYDVRWHDNWRCFVHTARINIDNPPTIAGQRLVWIPLDDDGDALRLAVQLEFTVSTWGDDIGIWIGDGDLSLLEPIVTDRLTATRRAIVRAAAEIGRNMK